MIMYAVLRAVLLIVVLPSRGGVTQDAKVMIFQKKKRKKLAATRRGIRWFRLSRNSNWKMSTPREIENWIKVALKSSDLGGSTVY